VRLSHTVDAATRTLLPILMHDHTIIPFSNSKHSCAKLSCVYFGPTDWTIATPPSLNFLTAHSDTVLQPMQNASARTVLHLKPSDHKTSLFQQLHWLPIRFAFNTTMHVNVCRNLRDMVGTIEITSNLDCVLSALAQSINQCAVPETLA